MDAPPIRKTLDDWALIERLLPVGWQEQARKLGALRRAREIADAGTLLRVLLVHLADGCSLAETAARAAELGWCEVSPAAVFKRLRGAEQWLRWMAEQLWRRRRSVPILPGRRVRVADATIVTETGRTGSEYRIHYAIDLSDLRCDHFEVTDHHTGESLRRLPVKKGDLILGDRGLAKGPALADVTDRGADVIVRAGVSTLPMFTPEGRRINLLARLRRLRLGRAEEWPASIREGKRDIAGRLVAIKRSARATKRARRRVVVKAQQNGYKAASAKALEAAGYVMIWTSVGRKELSAARVLELYRLRWQIELAFKRCKSILGLGQMPKHDDTSCRAWLHGKLLTAFLVERLIEEASAFSPWGYPLETPEQVA